MTSNAWSRGAKGLAGVLLFLGILIAANFILAGVRMRKDCTQEKLFTLSAQTRQLLDRLDQDVILKFYFSQSIEGLPLPIKQYAQRVEDLLREYVQNSHGRITLEIYDPRPDSEEEEWAQRYGVTGQPLPFLGGSPALYLGLVTVFGTREAVIPVLSPDTEPQLEYLITRLVHEITQNRQYVIGVLSALPVFGDSTEAFAQRRKEAWSLIMELRKQYMVLPLDAEMEEIPPEVDLLLAIHPRDLSERVLSSMDRYLRRGGRLLAFVDPLCIAQMESGEKGYSGSGLPERSDLNRLTQSWGLSMEVFKVVADPKAGTNMRNAQGGVVRTLTWLSLREENMNREDVSTSLLHVLLLPLAGAFTGEPARGLTLEPLLQTSEEAGLTQGMKANMTEEEERHYLKKSDKPLAVAVRLRGRFPTAFPDSKPIPQEDLKDGVVILVGDVDIVYDRFCMEKTGPAGQSSTRLINDNLSFAMNLAEQMVGSDALIGLRSRGRYERPFLRVLALEDRAQDRWKQQEIKLMDNLRESQERMNELARGKDPDQKYIWSPEQKQEIDQFRQEQFQIQRQLKEVRRKFREDVETLGLRLKVINIAAVPLLVALFGLARGVVRRIKH